MTPIGASTLPGAASAKTAVGGISIIVVLAAGTTWALAKILGPAARSTSACTFTQPSSSTIWTRLDINASLDLTSLDLTSLDLLV
tara:strand:+ start:84 stop:338 length:255 start_codon:yes stop_codon:yes gene_type:complete